MLANQITNRIRVSCVFGVCGLCTKCVWLFSVCVCCCCSFFRVSLLISSWFQINSLFLLVIIIYPAVFLFLGVFYIQHLHTNWCCCCFYCYAQCSITIVPFHLCDLCSFHRYCWNLKNWNTELKHIQAQPKTKRKTKKNKVNEQKMVIIAFSISFLLVVFFLFFPKRYKNKNKSDYISLKLYVKCNLTSQKHE